MLKELISLTSHLSKKNKIKIVKESINAKKIDQTRKYLCLRPNRSCQKSQLSKRIGQNLRIRREEIVRYQHRKVHLSAT